MDYLETIDFLFNALPNFEQEGGSGYKPGLERVEAMAKALGNPHKGLKVIHVGGTNGKGSTSSLVCSILQESGYKVGLFTSPHLVDFRERIRVNGTMISEREVVDFVANTRPLIEKWDPSFFEYSTLMCFVYFAQQNVDYAVIEVGMGGRLDCTNIVDPMVSVITNVSLDHTQFLGNCIEDIALEKAGIMKSERPVVIGSVGSSLRALFESEAERHHAPIVFAQDNHTLISEEATSSGWILDSVDYGRIDSPLGGNFQIQNARTVLSLLRILSETYDIEISAQAVQRGFANVVKNTGLRGRWEHVAHNPLVICDTGHNTGSFAFLSNQIQYEKCRELHIVFGMVADKDVKGVLGLLPKNAKYYFVSPNSSRAVLSTELVQMSRDLGLRGDAFSSVVDGIQNALEKAHADDLVYIGGSNYVVAEALKFYSKENTNQTNNN